MNPDPGPLLASLGLGGVRAVRYPEGSLPVYAVGDAVLKLYPAEDIEEADIEAAVLGAVAGKLSIPTPGVRAFGEHDGGRYLLMDRLRGESLVTVWPRLTSADRSRLAVQLGQSLAILHGLSAPIDLPPGDWALFIEQQRAGAVAQQADLAPHWLEQIPAFLDSVELPVGGDALLHTEVMRVHLLAEQRADGWELTGLFDFEPAMIGAAEYDFAAVGLFVAGGDLAFFRELLLAYGRTPDEALARRCLAYLLLHRYSNLNRYLREVPPKASTVDDLAWEWYG